MGCEPHRVGWDGSRSSDWGVQETVNLECMSWWGTKGCSRGGILFDNHRGNGVMDAVAATHSEVVVAESAALLRSPTGKYKISWPQALNKNRSRISWASLV